MSKTTIFTDIAELVTLKGAAEKQGRRIQEADLSIIKKAAFVVRGEKIVWVGEKSKIPKEFLRSKKVSLKNQIVLPGFVDCHTHMIFGGDRSNEFEMRNQGRSYQEISKAGGGIVATVKATRELSLPGLVKLSQTRVDEHIRQGATTIEIKSGYGLDLKNECKILEVAKKLNLKSKNARILATYLGPHAVPAGISKSEYLKSVLNDLKMISNKKLSNRADIFIEEIAFNVEESEQYFQKARDLGFDLVAHTNQLTASQGIQLAVKHNASSVDHLNFVNDSDVHAVAKSNTTAVVVPGADFYLKNPFAPARKFLEQGARVAIASNFNPGSCPSQDLQFVGALARLECKMTYFEVLNAFTIAAAYALRLENSVGSLEIGKSADFVTTNTSLTGQFYQSGARLITTTWRSGTKIS